MRLTAFGDDRMLKRAVHDRTASLPQTADR
jgi:hypothetical protein